MKDNKNESLVPYSSKWGVETFDNGLDNLVDRLFDSFWNSPSFSFERNWRPTDINEDKDNYYVEVELPGFKKSEINASVTNNILKVSAKNNKSSYLRNFSISGWDLTKIKSRLENGVLYVIVPKTENAKEKEIEIKEIKELPETKEK